MSHKVYFIILILFLSVVFILPSCSYKNEEDIAICDTSEVVTYNLTVVPILQKNCYRCHGVGSSSGSGDIILQDYDVLKDYAADGQLYGNIAHLPGYNNMPYDGGKLSDCEIAKIKKWIDGGYPNN